ncbi:LOW QUALITY PROTEIN: hypothetical protein PHMEG_00035715, partial [Phytophthora megakarya]
MAKGDKSAVPATPMKPGGMRSEASGRSRSSYSTPTTSRMTPITECSMNFGDPDDYSDAKEDDEDDYLEEKALVSELSGGTVVSCRGEGARTQPRPELEEVAGPPVDSDKDGSDGAKPSAAGKAFQSTHFRPSINGDTPGANKIIGKILELMKTKSNWMQMFGPTLVRQAVWMNLGSELVVLIDSTSTHQRFPSDAALDDCAPADAGTALQKKKLRTAFGVEEIAPGRQVVARQAFMPADPLKIPLPHTPVKSNETLQGVFGYKGSLYMHHIVTPRSVSRQERVVNENEGSKRTPNTHRSQTQQADQRYDLNEYSSDEGDDLLDSLFRQHKMEG